jgi:Na+/proline symporter/signal transduction histidine kinase
VNYASIDLILIILYLLFTLIIGIYSSKRVKSFQEYSIGKRNLSSVVLSMTVCATLIGGGSSLGTATEVYKVGVILIIAKYGVSLGGILIAIFIAPRMERFFGMLSVGEVVGALYGKNARIITGISGALLCIGRVSAQVMALGFVGNSLFQIPTELGIIIGSLVIIYYSSIGGVQAVAMTDVLQFVALIVTIPIVLNVGLQQVGGYEGLFKVLPQEKLSIYPDSQTFIKYLFVFIYMAIPMMSPPFAQRMLMAKDVGQIRRSFISMAIIDMTFTTISGIIGLISYALYPKISPNNAFLELLNSALPSGLKGLAVIGILSVIMSTADSYLNVMAVGIVNDVVKPLRINLKQKSELYLSKLCTVIGGGLSVLLALRFESIFELAIFSSNFWGPISVGPILLGIFGFKSSFKPFFVASLVGLSTFLFWESYKLKELTHIYSIIPSIFANIASFLTTHYIFKEAGGWIPKQSLKSRDDLRHQLVEILNNIRRFNLKKFYDRKSDQYGVAYQEFSIFLIATYIFPYILWSGNHSVEIYYLKFLSGVFCVLLLIKDIWPLNIRRFEAIYWYFVLTFSLPFTNTVNLLFNGFDEKTIIILALSIFLLALLVDWIMFIIIMIVGTVGGIIFTYMDNLFIIREYNTTNVIWASFTLVFSFIIGLLFSKSREEKIERKLNMARVIAGVIAHEVRNPLMILNGNISLLENSLESNQIPKAVQVSKKLRRVLSDIGTIIDITLVKLGTTNKVSYRQRISVPYHLHSILEEYPFKDTEKDLISINIDNSFVFYGDEVLFKHVIFNLIKNSLYYIKGKNKARVFVTYEDGMEYNIIVFKDTGLGISPSNLKKIFESFFSTNQIGTGLGLYFCKETMEKFGGKIECDSAEGEYTEFRLYFPKLN